MGDKLSEQDKEVFFRALSAGKIRSLAGYLDAGADVNMRDPGDETLLIRASKLQKEDVRSHVIRMLVRYGADTNLSDGLGRTALMHACIHKHRDDVVRRLIGTGKCDVNLRDLDGNTALMHAVISDNVPVIRILANSAHTKGSLNVNVRNNKGKSPLGLAMEAGYLECCYILVRECSANINNVPNKAELDILLKHFNENDPANILKSKPGSSQAGGMSKSSLRLDKISLHSRSLEKHDSTENNIGSGGEGETRSPTPMPTEEQYPILNPIKDPPTVREARRNYAVSSKETLGKYALSPRGSTGGSGREDTLSISTVHYGSPVERGSLSPLFPQASARPDDDSGLSLPPLSHSPNIEKKAFEFTDITTNELSVSHPGASVRKKKNSMLKKRSLSSKKLLGDSGQDGARQIAPPSMLSRGRLSPLPTVRVPDPYDGDDENQPHRRAGLPSLKQGKGKKNKSNTIMAKLDGD